jgi:hypothetical protein
MNSKLLLFVLFSLIIVGGLAVVVTQVMNIEPTAGASPKAVNIRAADKGLTLEERLGTDDNAAIAFLYGSDMQGSLDVCG